MPSTDHPPAADAALEEPRTRRDLLHGGVLAAIGGLLGVVGLSTSAEAKNGSAIRVGEKSSGTKTTVLEAPKGPVLSARVGKSGSKAIAVQGVAVTKKGAAVGVQGQSLSPDASAGQFVAKDGGTAVEATAEGKRGVALKTSGKLRFAGRAGRAQVSAGGADFIIPVAGGLSETSVVLATLQDHIPGVHVESAAVQDAEEGLIVVRLSGAVPEAATVGWFVLD